MGWYDAPLVHDVLASPCVCLRVTRTNDLSVPTVDLYTELLSRLPVRPGNDRFIARSLALELLRLLKYTRGALAFQVGASRSTTLRRL